MNLTEQYDIVYNRLKGNYGEPTWRRHLLPVDELVSTILSQSTSDTNRDKGFYALKERYGDWESVMNAPEADIVETIRPAGLANQKGPRIQAALRTIQQQRGELSLDFLGALPLDEAKAWLVNINGVGPKTAAIILLFAFNRPAFPVDTHVHRITQRLGMIGPKVTADKAHNLLENGARPDTYYAMHLNLIRHGRETCAARQPQCETCVLQDVCAHYQEKIKIKD